MTQHHRRHSTRRLGKSLLLGLGAALIYVSLPWLKAAIVVNTASLLILPTAQGASPERLTVLAESLRDVVSTHPSAGAYRKLGHIYLLLGKRQQAAEVLTEGLARYPDDHILALELGDTYERLGDRQRALQHWRRAGTTVHYLGTHGLTFHAPGEELDPTSRIALAAELWPDSSNAWSEIARLYMNQHMLQPAIQAFEKSIAVDTWTPSSAALASKREAHYWAGYLRYSAGDWEGSYRHYQAALELAEADRSTGPAVRAELHGRLGAMRELQGQAQEAVFHFLQAAELYVAAGNKADAIAGLEHALKLAPNDAAVQSALEELKK